MQYVLLAVGLVIACGGGDENGVVTDPPATFQAYVKASNTDERDRFASAIAISADGSTMAIGAPFEESAAVGIDGDQTSNSLAFAGAVYVFVRANGTWTQQAYLKPDQPRQGGFGAALALSGDGSTLVGAGLGPSNDGVYVFRRTGTAWAQQTRIVDPAEDPSFGCSVAVSDDGMTIAIGEYHENNYAGAVHVFVDNGSWIEQAILTGSNTEANDYLGMRIALSGDGTTLAVGAFVEASSATGVNSAGNNNLAPRSGAAYVFVRSGTTWSQQAYVKASNTEENDVFGADVALSRDGNTLAVSAPLESSNATGIDGDQTNNAAAGSGAVYMFGRVGTTWTQTSYIKASVVGGPPKLDAGSGNSDGFGGGVALSGDGSTLAVTASGESSASTGAGGDPSDNSAPNAGAVLTFVRAGSSWRPSQFLKASNTEAEDSAGASLAIAGNGATIVFGSVREASGSTGVGGDQADNSKPDAGAAYVYVTP